MVTEIFNIKGEKTGRTMELNDNIFGIKPNDHAIYLDVKLFLANRRQGTNKTKERAEVSRSTRKLFQQKHTGRARSGSFKSPVHKGGGTVHGPKPRDYDMKVNRQVKKLARISALTYKAAGNAITVVEDFDFSDPKTKNYATVLKNLNILGRKSLLLMNEVPRNVRLASRNIPGISIMRTADASTYHLMDAGSLILSESSLQTINKLLS